MGIFRSNNPLDYDQVDGIVIDERANDPSIQGLQTNVVTLVGHFERGPISLESVGSTKKFFELYGNNNSFLGQVALANKRFGFLKIKRVVASDAARASIVLQNASNPAATLTAKDLGVYGNSISVEVASGVLKITDTSENAVFTPETYAIADANELVEALSNSKLVDVSFTEAGALADLASTAMTGGSEGTVADTDYETALNGIVEERVTNLVFLDEYTATRNAYLKAHAIATQDRMVICAGAIDESVADVKTASDLLRDVDGRIVYAYNWLKTLVGGVGVFTSPASWAASIMSQTGPQVDPASADNRAFVLNASEVYNKLSRQDFIELKNTGVMSFENDADLGIKIKSGVTTQIANSSKITVVRRRMADFLTNSIGIFLKLYQNKINSKEERDAVRGAIKRFDLTYSEGAQKILPNDSEVNTGRALLVDTESLNDDQSIGEGKFFIKYKRRIYSSMRFIVLIAEIGEGVVVTETEE